MEIFVGRQTMEGCDEKFYQFCFSQLRFFKYLFLSENNIHMEFSQPSIWMAQTLKCAMARWGIKHPFISGTRGMK